MMNNNNTRFLREGLEYKDLDGMMSATVHVDEFSSKMGSDDDIVVVSFYVTQDQAADDLVNWFEVGYDFVLDADRSPGEIDPGRYLVFVELRRRRATADQVNTLIDDLGTLTEFQPSDWTLHYRGEEYPWSTNAFRAVVPDSPAQYRREHESELNEMRAAAGLETKKIYELDAELRNIQNQAGI